MLDLAASLYRRESLMAAARALGPRVEVALARRGTRWKITVSPAAREGEFLNEALSHEYRQRVLGLRKTLSAAALGRVLEKAFKPVPEDPLEMLEPQVREDRRREIDGLFDSARRLEK